MKPTEAVKLAKARQIARSGQGRRIRLAARLSCAQVGGVVGVADVTVLRWEAGTRKPSGRAALKYADLMDDLEEVVAS
jgi:DNA-binding transcriptional regulator YiaG